MRGDGVFFVAAYLQFLAATPQLDCETAVLSASGAARPQRRDGNAAPDAVAAPESELDLRTTYLTAKTTIAPTTTNKMCTERQIKTARKKNNVRFPMHLPVQGQWWSKSSTQT